MRFFSTLPVLAAALSLASSVTAAPSNTTVNRRTGDLLREKCVKLSGFSIFGGFNFGCICESDLDAFFHNSKISSQIFKDSCLNIFANAPYHNYPPNAQPTCDGNGGFNCGTLGKPVNGRCPSTNCPATSCSTNGSCCPRGQTYINGQCCAYEGCNQQCTPQLSCPSPKVKSNGLCCAAGLVGQQSICCPSGQVESAGKCACPAGKKFSADGKSCVNGCSNSSWSWCSTKCCPPGSTEDVNSRGRPCVCTNTNTILSDDGSQCISKCNKPNWTWSKTKCCPPGAEQNWRGDCACTNPNQELAADGQSCVNKCTDSTWNHCDTKCCPPGADEDANHNCVCTNPKFTLSNNKCVDRCPGAGDSWTGSRCCKDFLVEKNNQCVCPLESQKPNSWNTACVDKCSSNENYNPSTKACDPKCDTSLGYVFSTSQYNREGRCCKQGMTPCQTVCCKQGESEVAPGKCCTIGSTYDGHTCIKPSPKPKKRALTGRTQQVKFTGMAGNEKNELCPSGLAACLIPGTLTNDYECIDAENDLQSCGGCASMGTGQDCTTIENAKFMGCNAGKCEVYSCKAGFKPAGGNSCVPK